MNKKQLFKTIYRFSIVLLGILGIFILNIDSKFNAQRFVFFTNQSNLLCILMSLYLSVNSIIKIKRKQPDTYNNLVFVIKWITMIAITITMLVYNFILAPTMSFSMGVASLSNIILHTIVPLLYIGDFFLFDERGKTKWWMGFYGMIYPLIYFVYAIIRGYLGGVISMGELGTTRFPYFFIDPDKIGWLSGGNTNASLGVIPWFWIIFVSVFLLGLGYCGLDHINVKKSKS